MPVPLVDSYAIIIVKETSNMEHIACMLTSFKIKKGEQKYIMRSRCSMVHTQFEAPKIRSMIDYTLVYYPARASWYMFEI